MSGSIWFLICKNVLHVYVCLFMMDLPNMPRDRRAVLLCVRRQRSRDFCVDSSEDTDRDVFSFEIFVWRHVFILSLAGVLSGQIGRADV